MKPNVNLECLRYEILWLSSSDALVDPKIFLEEVLRVYYRVLFHQHLLCESSIQRSFSLNHHSLISESQRSRGRPSQVKSTRWVSVQRLGTRFGMILIFRDLEEVSRWEREDFVLARGNISVTSFRLFNGSQFTTLDGSWMMPWLDCLSGCF